MDRPPAPASTYRLQLNAHFTLHDAAVLVPYLSRLGVDAVYCSPVLRSAEGSDHGYDVVDHQHLDESRGGTEGLIELATAARAHSMTLVLDIVPNHVSVADPFANHAWAQLLREGRESPAARWFDVDWDAGDGRVRLPVLPSGFEPDRDLVVEDGTLRLGERSFPLAAGTETDAPIEQVLARQHYELVDGAGDEVNYRRFFAVSELAAIRVEEQAVFDQTHATVAELVASDLGISGLRVDHPDGLADPAGYLERLAASSPSAWIVVEKILAIREELPATWPVAGTTGYDALSEVSAVMIDPASEPALDALYRELTGDTKRWPLHAREGKLQVMATILRPEVRRLARLAPEVPDAEQAIVELAASFDVYRSYVPIGGEALKRAARVAARLRPDLNESLAALDQRLHDPDDELCVRFQQLTSAVMAKGVEDTAFYRYGRFVALNEVGGDPGRFGCEPDDFHLLQIRRQALAPSTMTTLSTHDTKRGEDVRARLFVLAELASEWRELACTLMAAAPIPNRAFGYLLWQNLVGAGPIERERLHGFAEKAMREASLETTWAEPDEAFERAVHDAVDAVYDDAELAATLARFAARIDPFAWSNSLSQKLVQLTMPGIPDCYQGSETGEFSLVDPDNRRRVDFAERADRLASGTRRDHFDDKLAVTAAALRARRDRPELFGSYEPLPAEGIAARHLLGFDRGGAITLATRLPVGLFELGGFAGTTIELPPGRFVDACSERGFTGTVRLRDVLEGLPVALLLREEP